MSSTEPFLRKVETAQEEQQHQHHHHHHPQSGVSYRAAVAAKNQHTPKSRHISTMVEESARNVLKIKLCDITK